MIVTPSQSPRAVATDFALSRSPPSAIAEWYGLFAFRVEGDRRWWRVCVRPVRTGAGTRKRVVWGWRVLEEISHEH